MGSVFGILHLHRIHFQPRMLNIHCKEVFDSLPYKNTQPPPKLIHHAKTYNPTANNLAPSSQTYHLMDSASISTRT